MSLKTWLFERGIIAAIGKDRLIAMFGKSWKTTLFGAGGLGTLIVMGVIQPLMDGDPATNPQWSIVIPGLFTALIGLFAKDSNVTGGSASQ